MSISTALRARLLAVSAVTDITSRIYVGKAEQPRTATSRGDEHVVIYPLDDDPLPTFDGTTGLRQADIDIDCYAAREPLVSALADAVHDAVKDYTGTIGGQTIQAVVAQPRGYDFIDDADGDDEGRHVYTCSYIVQYT